MKKVRSNFKRVLFNFSIKSYKMGMKKILLLLFLLMTVLSWGRWRGSRRWRTKQPLGIEAYKQLEMDECDFETIAQAHRNLLLNFRRYFRYKNISKCSLYKAGKYYVEKLSYIEEKYLNDVNNIILGDNNEVQGNDNLLKADDHSITGDGNYILHGKFAHHEVEGDNIVRIGRFDFDMDKVELLKVNPSYAVTILSRQS